MPYNRTIRVVPNHPQQSPLVIHKDDLLQLTFDFARSINGRSASLSAQSVTVTAGTGTAPIITGVAASGLKITAVLNGNNGTSWNGTGTGIVTAQATFANGEVHQEVLTVQIVNRPARLVVPIRAAERMTLVMDKNDKINVKVDFTDYIGGRAASPISSQTTTIVAGTGSPPTAAVVTPAVSGLSVVFRLDGPNAVNWNGNGRGQITVAATFANGEIREADIDVVLIDAYNTIRSGWGNYDRPVIAQNINDAIKYSLNANPLAAGRSTVSSQSTAVDAGTGTAPVMSSLALASGISTWKLTSAANMTWNGTGRGTITATLTFGNGEIYKVIIDVVQYNP